MEEISARPGFNNSFVLQSAGEGFGKLKVKLICLQEYFLNEYTRIQFILILEGLGLFFKLY